jgi:nucleoid DNA-binding protein
MRKRDIARQLARRARVSQAEAADRLDLIVHRILSDLRRGRESALPGLGKFRHGRGGRVVFEPEARQRHD